MTFEPLQLTGDIAGLRIGLLQEGFHMPEADVKIMTFVREAADRLSTLGATVEQVSVPMHFDGRLQKESFVHNNLTYKRFVGMKSECHNCWRRIFAFRQSTSLPHIMFVL